MIFEYIKDSMNNRDASIYIEKSSIMKKRIDEYLRNNVDSQYFEKVIIWYKNLEKSIGDAKQLIQ